MKRVMYMIYRSENKYNQPGRSPELFYNPTDPLHWWMSFFALSHLPGSETNQDTETKVYIKQFKNKTYYREL